MVVLFQTVIFVYHLALLTLNYHLIYVMNVLLVIPGMLFTTTVKMILLLLVRLTVKYVLISSHVINVLMVSPIQE